MTMGDSFFAYLQQMELMAFFSGYPLVYAIVVALAGKPALNKNFKTRLPYLLPNAYALVGTLYLGYEAKKFYPNYSFENIEQNILLPYLFIWALLSLLFWIPSISRIKWLSLLHSLVFFYFIMRDLGLQIFKPSPGNDVIDNDMRMFTVSLVLNLGALALVLLAFFLSQRFAGHRRK
jgi:hypothetical protein